MSKPIDVDLPHKLGKAEARRRIEGSFGKLADHIPGGTVSENAWNGDTLTFVVEAMGQRIAARVEVGETIVHAAFELPGFLSLFANPIRAQLEKEGPRLLK